MTRRFSSIRRGFTLIELLVVIAIIAILASILLPVYAAAREKSRQSACQQNQKEISTAMLQYVQDYDEQFPSVGVAGPTGWSEVIVPYIKIPGIFQCPSEPTEQTADTGNDYSDYFYNGQIGAGGCSDCGTTPKVLANFASPTSTVLIGDGNPDAGGSSYWSGGPGANLQAMGPGLSVDTSVASVRHAHGANYAFVDGHVKWLQTAYILSNPTAPDGSNDVFAVR